MVWRDERWSVHACDVCGLGRTEPCPGEAELQALYDDAYFDSYYAEEPEQAEKRLLKQVRNQRRKVRWLKRHQSVGRLLDVGCGRGVFLHAAALEGYQAHGLDISDANVESIRSQFGIEVTVAPFEAAEFEPGSFDVVTLWHCLEHVRSPHACLRRCREWLTAGGTLALTVPNYECVDAREAGQEWSGWCVPFHLFHFTRRSVRSVVEACGFEVVSLTTGLSDHVRARLRKLVVTAPLARPVAKLFVGDTVTVVCRRG